MAPTSLPSRSRLANQILSLIRDARFEPGHRLREQHLGDLMQVSRTPVRAALALLADHGIVESQRHKGYVLVRPAGDIAAIAVPTTAEQDLYEQIVGDRLAGAIPRSVTLSEAARRYAADRSMLLRTLSRLAEDGLVARNKGRGWTFLATLNSVVALRDSYDFRRTIEPASFLMPTFRSDPAALERARLRHVYIEAHPDIEGVDRRFLFDTDAAFHEMVADFSGNAFVLQSIQQQNRLRRLLEFGGYQNRRRVRDWCREHLAIIEAIRADARDKAAEFMLRHLIHAHEFAPEVPAATPGSACPDP